MSAFHAGELAVQRQAGVQKEANQLLGMFRPEIPEVARQFAARQHFIVLASTAAEGQVWASLRTGAPGFLSTPDNRTLAVKAHPIQGDPLEGNLQNKPAVGALIIDLAARRRMRVNGDAELTDSGLRIHTRQVYSNCPKYIQVRTPDGASAPAPQSATVRDSLNEVQIRWIEQADTFFIASAHPEFGADASHRGGNPGFVQVQSPQSLTFPDYPGNNLFNTLGNLAVNPHVGLLFVNWETGATLQLTGLATIGWNPRRVDVTVSKVIEIAHANPIHYSAPEPWPGNP